MTGVQTCALPISKLAMTEALLTESRERPAGRLKVTTTTGFGSLEIGRASCRERVCLYV